VKVQNVEFTTDQFFGLWYVYIYRVSQELRSLLRDSILELIPSQKHHIHMGSIRNGSGVTSF